MDQESEKPPVEAVSKQILQPAVPVSQKALKRTNQIIVFCYLFALVVMIVLEYSGWTYVFDIWPLSALVAKAKSLLLGPFISTSGPFFVTGIQVVVALILIADVLANGISIKKLAIVLGGIILSCILCSLAFNDRFVFFFCFVAAYPSKLALRSAIKTYLITGTLLTLLAICLTLLGLISTAESFGHDVLRRSLGFTYTNGFAVTASSLVMAWVYLKAPAWRWQDACVSIALLIIVLTISDGRSACIFALAQIVLTSLMRGKLLPSRATDACERALYKLATWLFPILGTLAFICLPVLEAIRHTAFYSTVNSLLSTRPDTWLDGLAQFGYPLFATPFESPVFCDNSFLHIAWTCGIVALVFFAILYVLTGKWTEKRKDPFLAMYIVLFILHCFTEILIYEFTMGFMILPLGAAVASAAIAPLVARQEIGMNSSSGKLVHDVCV